VHVTIRKSHLGVRESHSRQVTSIPNFETDTVCSIALMTDAVHELSDAITYAIAIYATLLSSKRSTAKYTFGYHRAETIGALVNAVSICVLSLTLVSQAVERLVQPEPIDGRLMFIFAAVGMAVNTMLLFTLGHSHDHQHEHDHANGHSDSCPSNNERCHRLEHAVSSEGVGESARGRVARVHSCDAHSSASMSSEPEEGRKRRHLHSPSRVWQYTSHHANSRSGGHSTWFSFLPRGRVDDNSESKCRTDVEVNISEYKGKSCSASSMAIQLPGADSMHSNSCKKADCSFKAGAIAESTRGPSMTSQQHFKSAASPDSYRISENSCILSDEDENSTSSATELPSTSFQTKMVTRGCTPVAFSPPSVATLPPGTSVKHNLAFDAEVEMSGSHVPKPQDSAQTSDAMPVDKEEQNRSLQGIFFHIAADIAQSIGLTISGAVLWCAQFPTF
jgi:Co/Zn/Cd efflux system component